MLVQLTSPVQQHWLSKPGDSDVVDMTDVMDMHLYANEQSARKSTRPKNDHEEGAAVCTPKDPSHSPIAAKQILLPWSNIRCAISSWSLSGSAKPTSTHSRNCLGQKC